MIGEAYELRIVLETFAVSKAAGRARPEALARLRAVVERMQALQREPETPGHALQAVALDREFHAGVCALAENDLLSAYCGQLNMHVNMSLIHEKTYPRLRAGWAEAHAEILRCLEHEPAQAVAAVQRHFRNVTDLLEAGAPADGAGSRADAADARQGGESPGEARAATPSATTHAGDPRASRSAAQTGKEAAG
jgi:DNA-binding GntR family transcriptional regulator